MAELALDQWQRDPFVQQLNSVRMAQLVRRYAPTDSGLKRELVKLAAHCAGRPRPPAGGTVDHAEQRPDRKLDAVSPPWLDLILIPTSE